MIVPMKKVHLIFHTSHWHTNIKDLQHLGLVDINTRPIDTDTSEGREYQLMSHAYEYLQETEHFYATTTQFTDADLQFHGADAKEVSHAIVGYYQEQLSLQKKNSELEAIYQEMKCLGEVSQKSILALEKQDIRITVYKAEKKAKVRVPAIENVVVKKVFSAKQHSYWAVICYKGAEYTPPLSWNEFKPSEQTPSEIQQEIKEISHQIEELASFILQYQEYSNTLKVRMVELENIILRQQVIHSGNVIEDSLLMVSGFIPSSESTKLNNFAKDKAWGLVICNPDPEEDVPTLTKNLPFVKIIKPLFKLMDTVPGYKEFDISAMFLLFISLFFSMIIGDAGYGFVLFGFTSVATLTALKKGKIGLTHGLLLWFSTTTIVWGAITGNWFGYAPFAEHPFLKQFVIPAISNTNQDSKEVIMLFCFRIGLVHLILAHLWKTIRMFKETIFAVIHELANITFLSGLYYVTLMLILDPEKYPLPNFVLPLIFISFGIIVITCEQQKGVNFFVGVGKGLASLFNLFLGGVGNLADVISYIRLYAVGLASLAIAQAFNEMGMSIFMAEATPGVTILLYVAGSVVILFGHTLNLAMGLLAVMVHGVRLNMLEFGMHLGMEWTGRNFTPFQKKFISLEDK